SPAMSPSSVDLPLPDGPVTATTCPAATSRVTPSRTVSGRPPLGSRITRSRTWTIIRPILHFHRGHLPPPPARDRRVHGPRLARDGGAGWRGAARRRRARRQPHRGSRCGARRGVAGAVAGAAPSRGLGLPRRECRRERRHDGGRPATPRLGAAYRSE